MFLYDFISKYRLKGSVLDVGCGCGILGLLIKERFDIELNGIDILKNNIELSKINAKNNALDADFVCGDFLEYKFDKRFDVIVSNPPFYDGKSKQSENNSKRFGRYDTSLPLKDFIKKCNSLLKPRGELFFCYDSGALQRVCAVLSDNKLQMEDVRFVHPKRDKNSTIVMIRSRKSSKSKTKCLPPLFTHENGDFTKEVEEIYKKLSIKSLKCEMRGTGNEGRETRGEMSEVVKKDGFSYGFKPSACNECDGRCCRGESGYIFVDSDEIKNIAEFLGLDVKIFKKDYLNKVKYRYSIKELKINGEYLCLFFDEKHNRCKIYDVRPKQCRTFPFWGYFKDKIDEVKKECIGIV